MLKGPGVGCAWLGLGGGWLVRGWWGLGADVLSWDLGGGMGQMQIRWIGSVRHARAAHVRHARAAHHPRLLAAVTYEEMATQMATTYTSMRRGMCVARYRYV